MKEKKPCQIDQKRLVTLFKDIKRLNSDETRFCFLIGAGASKSSGIKTGWELSVEWYDTIKNDLSDEDLIEWEQSISFDKNNISAYYPHLYKKRYETSPQIGYEEFKKLMENIEPGIGYVILSQIITSERHNFVITTNFDYLIEDSVRMYTSKKPFTAGHETLAEFISSQTERPTIIKVHRDLFLQPFNDEEETKRLKDEWQKALMPILRNFNLLVVGYGGNDGSLMDYLSSIDPQNRKAIYWCIRNENEINEKISNLLNQKDYIVKINGFDELMISLNDSLEYKVFENLNKPSKHPFVLAAETRIYNLNEKLKELLDKLSKDKQSIPTETKELFSGPMKYIIDAYTEKDADKANEIYQKGLLEYSTDPDILGNYALFLSDIPNEYDKAEEFYQKAIELKPDNAKNIGNYAIFLSDIRKDYVKAEELFQKAMILKPNDANKIGNYALFLSDIYKDYDKAEKLYKKAIELDPSDDNNVINYAQFLSDIRKDYDNAEVLYKKAIELKPDDADFIGNYASFLKNIRNDYDKAEELFKKAIELDPNNANNINNYAILLKNIHKDYDKADELYKKAIELKPDDTDFISNYANFLSDIRKDYDKADELYKKAIELDPNNANKVSNYAIFLSDIPGDYDNAEKLYKKAIELEPDEAYKIGNYALFLSDIRKDYDKAEKLYQKAIELKPKDAINIGNYAHHLIMSKKDFDNAEENIDKALILADKDELDLLSELWFYRYAHYNKWYEEGEQELTNLISKGAKSIGWNLEPHIEIAKSNNHPNIQKLQEFADLITK